MTDLDLQDPTTTSWARSALYGVVASLFRHPANSLFRNYSDRAEWDALLEALRAAGYGGIERITQFARGLHEASHRSSRESMTDSYIALFGHTSRGTAPPYETEYGGGGPFSQPQELSDISGFYSAFGLALDPSRHERFDHICCECEFMCFLCAREAHALERADTSTAQAASAAQRLFLRDHLGAFGRTFFYRVTQEEHDSWHASAAQFAAAFLEAECRRFDLPVDRAYLPLRPAGDFNVPLACGACATACGDLGSPPE